MQLAISHNNKEDDINSNFLFLNNIVKARAKANKALEDHKKPVNPFSLNIPMINPAMPNKKKAKMAIKIIFWIISFLFSFFSSSGEMATSCSSYIY